MRARDAVGAGVAAADHDHVLARGGELGRGGAGDVAVALVEVLHREVHAAQLAPVDREVARHARAGAEDGRVEAVEIVGLHVDAEAELDALVGELLRRAARRRASRS